MNGPFSTAEVAELTGASLRQLDDWARKGYLRPSGREAAGKGSRRRYTFSDIVAVSTIVQLRRGGCPLQKIRKAVKYLRAHFPTESDSAMLSCLTLLTDGDSVYLYTDRDEVMEVVSRQTVWSVPLGLLISQARQRVEELPMEWVEEVRIEKELYHLLVTRDVDYGGYLVQCRELPGAMEQGETAAEAVANGKDAIESVLSFKARRERSRGAKRAKAG